MTDSFARDISYARISLTDFCNLHCRYCIPPQGVPEHRNMLSYDELSKLIDGLVAIGVKKIRFTGGEPTIRPGVLDFFEQVCRAHDTIKWALTTNALTLAQDAERIRKASIQFLNISLDTTQEDEYHMLTGGRLSDSLSGIDAALHTGFERIKINAVLIKGISERQIPHLVEWSRTGPVDVRFIELMPMGDCQNWAEQHFLPASAVLKILPNLVPDAPEPHAPATYYRLPGYLGRIGLITPLSCDFCSACNRIRITADGKLRPCLHSDQEIDLRPVLQDPEALADKLKQAVLQKPERHFLAEKRFIERSMSQVGG